MGRRSLLAAIGVLAVSSPVWADDAAPAAPPPPPPPAVVAPAPPPTTVERRIVIESAPSSAPTAPSYAPAPYYAPSPATGRPVPMDRDCTPCGPQGCFQKRDECGCPVDSCGNRFGPWMITLEGALSSISSPDGILGETLFVPGNQLGWENVDYDGQFAGRLTISYAFECESRIELRGTYWGNPDASDTDSGFFAASPGDDGLGDVSRPVNASLQSEAEMWGVEFNWWTELSCSGRWRVDAGVGIRYVSFDEDARVDFVTTGPGAFPVDNGYVRSEVENDWLGAQLMLAAHADVSDCVEVYGSLKAMFGSVDRTVHVTDLDIFAGGSHSADADDDEFVFGLDFELGLKWRLSPCLLIGASYNMFFLDGVQRAEDGFDFGLSNSGAVQAQQSPDQLVAHSVFFGVTFNF